MIKKAQVKFIAIIMSILLVVFSLIFGIISILQKKDCNNAINSSLSDIERLSSKGLYQNEGVVDGLVVLIKEESPNKYSYDILTGKDNFTLNQIENIVITALNRDLNSGSIGNVYYTVTNPIYIPTLSIKSQKLIVASDMTDIISNYHSSNRISLFILLVIYAFLFLIVWGLSFTVFAPIKENFYKQKRFISDASHELKTPVAIISANADVLKNQTANKYLDSIKSQTERLNFLVTDLLTLARIDEGNVNVLKEKINLSDEITEALLPFDALCFENGKTLLFDINEDIQYVGDRQSIKQIVNILIDNAIKYSSKSATVKVSLKKEGSKIKLTVFNTGSAVPDELSDKIFERFYRGDNSRSRETGGSGLGLSIAKSIAEANKWKISARSVLNESMTITLIM